MADAIVAARHLELTEAELAVLAEILRLSSPARDSLAQPKGDPTQPRPPAPSQPQLGATRDEAEAAPTPMVAAVEHERVTLVETLDPETVGPVTFDAEQLAAPQPELDHVSYEPPVPANQLRAALSMLVRRPRPGDSVDIAAAIEHISSQRPLTELPRRMEQSLDRGARVIADVGSSMEPYLEDVAELVQALREVVGHSQVEVSWVSDATPLPTTPVDRPTLVISTLGAVRPRGGRIDPVVRWRTYAEQAADDGVDVAALVPHRGHPWSSSIVSSMRLVSWDDLANVGRGR